MFAYLACGALAGLGGVIMASQLKSGSATYGNMYELYVIAAVVVGGTSLSGGEGKMLGTLTGAFTIAVIQDAHGRIQLYIRRDDICPGEDIYALVGVTQTE
jgi:ribose transport system permease protein